MNVFVFFFLSVIFFVGQPGSCQTRSIDKSVIVSLDCHDQSLRSVLESVRVKTGVNFIFKDNLIDDIKITSTINNSTVKNAINKILTGLDISYKEFGKNSFVLFKEKKIKKTSYKAIIVNQNTSDADTVVSFVNPQMISEITPVYPIEASKNNIEGKVKVKFLINREGEVNKVLIQQSSGSDILDSAALDYINRLKFIPAKTNGIPRSVWMSIVLKYLVLL